MESYSSNHATDSPSLHLISNFDHASSLQSAAGDGNQAEIIPMDSSVYKAAAEGDVHVLQQLPEIDLQEQLSPKQNSVLHIAAQFGQLHTVQWILGSPWSSSLLKQKNLKGDTPLHLAAREGHFLVAKALIDAAKLQLPHDIENGISAEKAMLRLINKEGDTALHEAVRYNRFEVVKLLIAEDPDLFAYTENVCGGTPLYMAAERGFRKLVEVIIDNSRTSPAYSGFYGRTALHAAVIHKDTEMTKKILEWKPELMKEVDEHGWSPLHDAAYVGQTTIVREFLDKSDKRALYLGTKDGDNLTALHIAAARRHTNIVEMLASNYPDCCEQVDDEGNNVFHFAMMSTGLHASKDFLKNRWLRSTGLINEKNDEGNTPLHLLSSGYVYDPVFVRKDNIDKLAFNNQKLTAADIFLMAHDTCSCKDHLAKVLGKGGVLPCIGPKGWFRSSKNKSTSTGSQGNGSGNNNHGCREEDRRGFIKRSGEIHLVVATLIATVAFAAGFTLPGGYNQGNGMAMLSKKAAFTAFLVMDAVAMVLSVSAVFNYLFMSLHERRPLLARYAGNGFFLTMSAMAAMVVAFMTGLYAVLPPSSGIANIFICIFFFLFFCLTCHQFLRGATVGLHFNKKYIPSFSFFW